MASILTEKRKWSEDGQSTLTRLVFYDHSSESMPNSYSVRFNREVVYDGYDFDDAADAFYQYEGLF
jgi:hypothetical protein